MKITVDKDNVKIEEFDVVHEGEHRVNKCSFSFSEEYTEELVKKAIFTSQNSSVEVAIINNECNIPTEILKARNIVLLGVYAYKVVDDKLDLRYSPSPDAFKVNSGSYIEGANESEEITPSQFEQYMQAMNDGLNKVEESIKKMDEATSSANDLVDNINQKLENGDFIGPEGTEGPQGVPGTNGKDGVGITTITSGQSTVEEDKTITPVTVQKSDGSSQSFKVEAKNGIDGQNGQNGKDGVNGQNGQDGTTPNIQIGTVETLEPNEQATVTRTGTDEEPVFNFGIPKGQQGEKGLDGTNGTDGKDATINSQNTVEITTDNNITLDQQESMLKLGLNSQLILKQNAEGTDNTFDDGLESPLYALAGDGKSEQVVTTGANLLNLDVDNNNQSYGGMTVIIDKDSQTVNFDGSLSDSPDGGFSSFNRQFPLKEPITVEAGSYDFFAKAISGSGLASGAEGRIRSIKLIDTAGKSYDIGSNKGSIEINKASFTFEQPVTITTIQIIIYSNMSLNNYKIGLYFGKQNVEYEPYTGGQPSPSPDYEQPINSVEGSVEFACRGKNLFDGVNQNYYLNSEVYRCGYAVGDSGLAINVSQYSQLTVSTQSIQERYRVGCVDSLSTGAGFREVPVFNGVNKDGTNDSITVDTTDYNYLIINATNLSVIQVEEGSVATEIEPYIEPNKVTFNLNDEKLRSVGDVKDELVVDLSTGDYYKVENVGEIIFDGSTDENWGNVPDGTSKERYTSSIIQNLVYTGTKLCQSNYFKSGTSENYYEDGTIRIAPSGGVSIYDDLFTSMDNFKQWLSTHNTIVNYILKTPTTKKLGTLSSEDLAKLKTFKGYNNVTINTNLGLMNIRFTYGLDIKKYVDNKIAQLSEQLIKGE